MKQRKVKDLNAYLTQTTGLDADARQQWRDCIHRLMDEAKTNPAKKQEALNVFNSFAYWQAHYQNQTKA